MKRKVALLILAAMLVLNGCSPVPGTNTTASENTRYRIFLNSGSCFVYTFEDPDTGVWYISSSKGVTPRLNPDGSLYVSETD